jgi:hypothetical protein
VRIRSLIPFILLVSCAPHQQAAPQPSTHSGIIRTTVITTDRPDTLPPPAPEDSAFLAFRHRNDSLAALVDTIVVLSPDSIVLHVGEAIQILPLLKTEGRQSSGQRVSSFPGEVLVEDMTVAENREAGLTGLQVGHTRLVIRLINKHAHAPPSYIPIVVRP